MRNIFLILVLVLTMASGAFAQPIQSPGAVSNEGSNNNITTTVGAITDTFAGNIDITGSGAGASATGAGATAGATARKVIVGVAPQNFPPPQLNFIQPGQRDVTWLLPKFGCGNIFPISVDDCIYDVLYVNDGIKFKALYKEVLDALKDSKVLKVPADQRRYQIIEDASTKTWVTPGGLNLNGVGSVGSGAMGGGGGFWPQIGRSKTSNLYTVYIVAVQKFKKEAAVITEEPVIVIMSQPRAEEKVVTVIKEPIKEKEVILVFDDIHFDFDKSTLTPEAQAILKRNIKILKANPKTKIRIAGYTSASGTESYNQALSERRANAVKDYLAKEGLIAPNRLSMIGYGKTRSDYEPHPKDLYSEAAKANMKVLFQIIVE